MKRLITLCFLLLFGTSLLAQNPNVKLFYNEYSNYPKITTGFELYDANGNQLRNDGTNINIKKEDIVIQELRDGELYEHNPLADPICPRADQTTSSLIITIGVTKSLADTLPNGMTKIDYLKFALQTFIENIDPKRTEIAITLFAGDAVGHPTDLDKKPFQPFTSNKNELIASIKSLGTLYDGNNWNAAFLGKTKDTIKTEFGSFYYCGTAVCKYKPTIIFITDTDPDTTFSDEMQEAIQEAVQNNTSVYCIQFSDKPFEKESTIQDFIELSRIGKSTSDNTENYWLSAGEQLGSILQTILDEAGRLGDPPPCYMTWTAGCETNSATFTFPNHGMVSAELAVDIPEQLVPKLEITPNIHSFKDVAPGSSEKITFDVKAVNNDVNFDQLNIFDSKRVLGRYSFSDWGAAGNPPFTLKKDSTTIIEISYEPKDSLYSQMNVEFIGSACSGNIFSIKSEMIPYIAIVDLGNVPLGSIRDTNITQLFCNKTGGIINILGFNVENKTNLNFSFRDIDPIGVLDSSNCLSMTLSVNPVDLSLGPKTIKFTINTDYNNNMNFEGIFSCNVVEPISVKENYFSQKPVYIYPNPAKDEINIFFSEYFKNSDYFWGRLDVCIYNYLGIEVKKLNFDEINELEKIQTNIEDLQSGMYFVGFKTHYYNEILPLSIIK